MSFQLRQIWCSARLRTMVAATIAAAPLVLATPAAQAAVLKNVSEYAGERCNTPPRGSGVIVGFFIGYSDISLSFNDSLQTISRYRCFTSMQECQGWLYTMQSLYSAGIPRVVKCMIR